MGIMDIFKKKPSAEPQAPAVGYPVPGPMPPETPTDQVMAMQQQGLTNNQIIQTLQRQGFQPQQIYDAMAQAEMRGGAEPMPEAPSAGPGEFPAPSAVPSVAREAPKGFEEIAESIVEEKWNEFTRELGKMNEWKEASVSRLDKIEQSVSDLKADIDSLHKAVVSKVSEYDRNLLDVGTEIKAMEKVFQKVLPDLTGSVAELSRITKTVKQKPAPAKKK